jgi:hypothetical protein
MRSIKGIGFWKESTWGTFGENISPLAKDENVMRL